MKKQHLDPNAKRDFSVLSDENKKDIKNWLKKWGRSKICPFGGLAFPCRKCHTIFPELKRYKYPHCPCSVLYIKDVIAIAKEAIK